MLAFTIRRVLIAIPIFFGITIMTWLITTTNPDGGALQSYLGRGKTVSNQQIAAIKHRLGLDQPLPVRYIYWMGNLFHGDLGKSIVTKHEVTRDFGERIGPTLLLGGIAFLLQELLAIPLGVFSAVRRGSVFDQVFTVISYILFSLPTFWFGLMSIVIFGVFLGWFPFDGIIDLHATGGNSFGTAGYTEYFHAHTITALLDIARHLVLPVIVLGTVGMAGESRFLRAQMLEVLNQDYVRTAKAKGASQRIVIWKHAVRNALLPTVTNIGLSLPVLLGGAVVTEQIFTWPGMGQLYIKAATAQDYPTVIAFVVFIGTATLIANILTDIAYGIVDPRIRLS